MDDLERDPIWLARAHDWRTESGLLCVVRVDEGGIPHGYVRLPPELVGAWPSYQVANTALGTQLPLVAGPVDDANALPGENLPGWLGIDAVDWQAHHQREHDTPLDTEALQDKLIQLVSVLADAIGAAQYRVGEGQSVLPAECTYDEAYLREHAKPLGNGSSTITIVLQEDESAWMPARAWWAYEGPLMVTYVFFADGGCQAHRELHPGM